MTQAETSPASGPVQNGEAPIQQALRYGQVSQVLSGDCVLIRPVTQAGLQPERFLAFSNITAPRLEKRPNNTGTTSDAKDEPFAWEAREFVRQKAIGQMLAYTVDHAPNTAPNRDYGVLYLGKSRDCENLTKLLVTEGLAEVRKTDRPRVSAAMSELIALEEQAKATSKGKWNLSDGPEHVRNVKWNVEPLRKFVDERKGQRFNAVVENVRDGSTIRAFLLPDFHYVTLSFSGIKTPAYQYDPVTNSQTPEPMAEEVKAYVEQRLLHRDVHIVVEGVSGNQIMGSVFHPTKGNIALYLLQDGLAKIVDWSIASVTSNREEYVNAENKARTQLKGIWKENVIGAFPVARMEHQDFTAIVVEINTADTITVLKDGGEEKKIKFSSLRGPRLDDNKPRDKSFRPLYHIPCMYEAREFLRQRLVGERVLVAIDYIQPANDNFPEATCCTVTASGHNIAEALVAKGLATVVRHRRDDDSRSRAYEDLLNAEAKATKNKTGLHDPNKSVIRVADICGEIKLARNFLTSLSKGEVSAVIEHVVSASRFRLYVKSATCVLSFLLAGIDCPKPERTLSNQHFPADPFGEEAKRVARLALLQRDVTIKVENMDKVGNFIGWLYLKDKSNFNAKLVKEGLATINGNLSDRHEHYLEMTRAEEEAKTGGKNLWSLPDFKKEQLPVETETEEVEMSTSVERRINMINAVCTEVGKNLNFFVQHVQDGHQVECLMTNLQESVKKMVPAAATSIKPGDVVAAKFSLDSQWYRAKIEKRVSMKEYSVLYVDYGNRENVSIDDLCTLPSEFSISAFPAHAHEYQLAFVKLPPREDLKVDSIQALRSQLLDQKFNVNIEYKLGGTSAVTVFLDNNTDLGLQMVENGHLLAFSRREPKFKDIVAQYQTAEQNAKKFRKNMWCYGDITDDDH